VRRRPEGGVLRRASDTLSISTDEQGLDQTVTLAGHHHEQRVRLTTFITCGHGQAGHQATKVAATTDFICHRVMNCTVQPPTPIVPPSTASEFTGVVLGPVGF
jgi:hypothetical protein